MNEDELNPLLCLVIVLKLSVNVLWVFICCVCHVLLFLVVFYLLFYTIKCFTVRSLTFDSEQSETVGRTSTEFFAI